MLSDDTKGFDETTVKSAGEYGQGYVNGKIVNNAGVYVLQSLTIGERLRKGDIVCGLISLGSEEKYEFFHVDLERSYGFLNGNGAFRDSVLVFTRLNSDWRVGGESILYSRLPFKFYVSDSSQQLLQGAKAPAGKYAIRTTFDLDSSKVVYVKPSADNTNPTISSSFTETPASIAYSGDDKKLVIKSDDVSIGNSISNNKLTSDRQDSEVAYRDNTIYVPYYSKTLTINPEAFNTNNASHITALINQAGVKQYAVLGDTTSDLTIDLTSILDTKTPGSKIAISFYAEKINGENISDEISATPVTINLEVAQGSEQTIKYELDGGSGAVSQTATIRAGKQYQLADGSTFSKESNKFSAWQMTYTPYGENESKTRIVSSNETIVVPDAQGQTIAITALYSGIKARKYTETDLTKYEIIWDVNAPDGVSGEFQDNEDVGEFNSDRSVKYQYKRKGEYAYKSSTPKLNSDGYEFEGWYIEASKKEVYGAINVVTSVRVIAKWIPYTFASPKLEGNYSNFIYNISHKLWDLKTIGSLKAQANDLSLNKENSEYYSEFKKYLTDDSYRVYSLLKADGSYLDSSKAENWVEFRLIGIGEHDGDKSGLTFQMVNRMPKLAVYNSYSNNNPDNGEVINWGSCELMKSMQEDGSIFNQFSTDLTSRLRSVEKKYNSSTNPSPSATVKSIVNKFFILSYTEFQSSPNVSNDYWADFDLGSTYEYWSNNPLVNAIRSSAMSPFYTMQKYQPLSYYDLLFPK